MDISAIIEWYLNHLNYWVLTILMILENSVVPLPAELIVTPAAYRAANGDMSLTMLILCTTFGSVVGAIINYYISRSLGRFVIYKFMDSRWGKMLLLNQEKLKQAENLFLKHGKTSTFFGRLLPVGRQLISIPAGLAKMKLSSFIFYTAIGSAIWNGFLSSIGFYLAKVLPEDQLQEALEKYSLEVSLGFVLILFGYILVKKMIKK